MTDETRFFRSETEWYNYYPKLNSIRFEYETLPWSASENIKHINGLMYYFKMNESNMEFNSLKLNGSQSNKDGHSFITFDGLSTLSANEKEMFAFKIAIEIQFDDDYNTVKFQLNPLKCYEFGCNGKGECYADYRSGIGAKCRCNRGLFGDHCQYHDPCLEVRFTLAIELMLILLF